jgi:hypothetical protein
MHKRIAIALAAGAAVATVGFASASALNVDAATIQYGSASVTGDVDGVVVNWGLETDDNTVRLVRVDGLDSGVQGADLFVKVGDKMITPKGGLEITGSEAKISLPAPYLTPQEIDNVQVWIEG